MSLLATWQQRLAEQPAPDAALTTPLAAALSRLPKFKTESWRNTNPALLHQFPLANFHRDAAPVLNLPRLDDGFVRIIFVDGVYAESLSDTPLASMTIGKTASTQPSDVTTDALLSLSHHVASTGLQLTVEDGEQISVHVVSVLTKAALGRAIHLQHDIRVHGSLRLIFEQKSANGIEAEQHHTLAVQVSRPDSVAEVLNIQRDGDAVRTHFQSQLNLQSAKSTVRFANLDLGAAMARKDVQITAHQPQADIESLWISATQSGSRHDTQLTLTHAARECRSQTQHRALVERGGSSSIDGLIHIKPAANKTQAEMRLANMLLARGAEANAKPQLMIETDDVKCAHGVTYGQLDDDALFYLRSRGLSAEAARNLLTYSFLEGAISSSTLHESLKAAATQCLQQYLPDTGRPVIST